MAANVETLVREYVAGWRTHDRERIDGVISDSCIVVESDGTTFAGREEILRWMDRWIASGSEVESWDISSLVLAEASACIEWQFTCVCGGNRTSFPGASVFQIRGGKIVSVVEYRRKGWPNQPMQADSAGPGGRAPMADQ